MDPKRFDDLTRALASGVSRRHVLRLMAAALVGTVLPELVPGQALADCVPCSPSSTTFCCQSTSHPCVEFCSTSVDVGCDPVCGCVPNCPVLYPGTTWCSGSCAC